MIEIIGKSISVVAPVFALAALGYFCGRESDAAPLNRVNLSVFLPLLVFVSLAGVDGDFSHLGYVAVLGAGIVLGSGVVALGVCRLVGWNVREIVPPSMFSNYGNMGLPLIALAFGEDALAMAVVLFMAGNALHVTVGFKILDGKLSLFDVVKNPIFVAAFLGVLTNITGISIPSIIQTPLDMGAAVSVPLMLFALGARMREVNAAMIRGSVLPALLCPASGLVCYAVLFPLMPDNETRMVLAVFAALPPALLNYIFAEQFGLNARRIASMVMTGNLLSVVVIPLVLAVVFYFGG